MENKCFTTYKEQVDKLKGKKLRFGSEETAINVLRRFGYYNIINGYKDPYIFINNDGKEEYHPNVTFEQVYSLYTLDKNVGYSILNALLELEDNLYTATAHVLSESFTEKESAYLNRKNFKLGKERKNGEYQLDDILKKLQKILNDDSQPFKHYREVHGNVPPWILLKGASFGNVVNFIKLLKPHEKNKVISILYDFPLSLVESSEELKKLFMDTLFVALDYRNRAAHGGRIYNFESKSSFRYNSLLHGRLKITSGDYRKGKGQSDICSLLGALTYLDNTGPFKSILESAGFYVELHLGIYPEDEEYLKKYLNMDKLKI